MRRPGTTGPKINVRHLTVFRAVMRTGSVSAAARTLNVSQPAVTKSLQAIEREIGVPLFQRIKGRLQATPESALLMPKVDQVFRTVEDVERLAAEIAGAAVGRIAIATATTISTSVTAAAIARYRKKRPNVTVQVLALATRQVIEEVANNQVDIGLTDGASLEGALEARELCRAFIGCVLPRDHPLARKKTVDLRDLVGEQIIAFHEHTVVGHEIRRQIGALGLPMTISIATNQSLVACLLTKHRIGIPLIDPFTMLSGLFPELTILPLTPLIEMRPRLVFPPNRPLSIAAQEFVQTVTETMSELVPTSPLLRPL
ncbi:MAG: LysR family transcriptional regulator [Rhodospirillales bacterium]|nr:LysR family transcriptional regulator [Rhodospirillales bacterium]